MRTSVFVPVFPLLERAIVPEGTMYLVSGDDAKAIVGRAMYLVALKLEIPKELWSEIERLVREHRITVVTNIGTEEVGKT